MGSKPVSLLPPTEPSNTLPQTTVAPIIIIDSSPPRAIATRPATRRDNSQNTSASLSRQTSSSTVIEIRDDSPEITRQPPVKSSKPTHPFFQQSRAEASISTTTATSSKHPANTIDITRGSDRESAIDLTSVVETPKRRARREPNEPQEASWPAQLSDHVNKAPRALPNQRTAGFARRSISQSTSLDVSNGNWYQSMFVPIERQSDRPSNLSNTARPVDPTSSTSSRALEAIPEKHQASSMSNTASHEMWTLKYRPTKAQEVLGNELNAQYIKDWLRALELGLDAPSGQSFASTSSSKASNKPVNGLKRPRVVRAVEKPPKKKKRKLVNGYEDDWVVDDEESQIPLEDDDDEDSFLASLAQASSRHSSPLKRFSVPPPTLPTSSPSEQAEPDLPKYGFSNRLTNSLLITGPPGCGKTASVYACAQELGWSVFEVNPGMGKRGGAQILNMLDGVGKNHTLGAQRDGQVKFFGSTPSNNSGRAPPPPGSVLARIFGAATNPKSTPRRDVIVLDSDDSNDVPLKDSTPSKVPSTTPNEGPNQNKVNQSIILLEEVDLLFQGEGGFWQAVIDIIKESRRPVIMTCNGEQHLHSWIWN